jgi:hypothetical protein
MSLPSGRAGLGRGMGRHSRGGGTTPPPEPEPPAPRSSRYAPRSAEDTGTWDHSTYRVVDVGLPVTPRTSAGYADPRPGPPAEPPAARPTGPGTYGGAARTEPPAGAYGSRSYEPVAFPLSGAAPAEPSRYGAPEPHRYGGPPAAEPSRFGGTPEPSRFGGTPAEGRFGGGPAAEGRPGGGLAAEGRLGGVPAADGRFGGGPAVESRYDGGAESRRYGATRADLVGPPSRAGAAESARGTRPAADPYGARRADRALEETGFLAHPIDPDESTPGLPPLAGAPRDSGAGLPPLGGALRGAGGRDGAVHPLGGSRSDSPLRTVPTEPRFGATRADLAGADTDGATALQPSAPPEPDEVTDTGARRARSAFRLAADPVEDSEPDTEPEDEHEESSLLVQWGVFVAQTLTGAAAGLGVWLGFYRLWSTWPLYAAPGVGVVAIVLLVTARTLRRRHGKELDLLTTLVTYAVTTVLTVLPAAFALQSLA